MAKSTNKTDNSGSDNSGSETQAPPAPSVTPAQQAKQALADRIGKSNGNLFKLRPSEVLPFIDQLKSSSSKPVKQFAEQMAKLPPGMDVVVLRDAVAKAIE